jgi:outer membrane protein OmpA-like peptidoglycan-associated protein
MEYVSWGKERPDVIGSDETAYAQNRRGVTLVTN